MSQDYTWLKGARIGGAHICLQLHVYIFQHSPLIRMVDKEFVWSANPATGNCHTQYLCAPRAHNHCL